MRPAEALGSSLSTPQKVEDNMAANSSLRDHIAVATGCARKNGIGRGLVNINV